MRKMILGLPVMLCLFFTACKKEKHDAPIPGVKHESSNSEVNGSELVAVDFEDGSKMRIYEFEHGEVAIRLTQNGFQNEKGNIIRSIKTETISEKLDGLIQADACLVDIYKTVATKVNPSVLSILAIADQRIQSEKSQDVIETLEDEKAAINSYLQERAILDKARTTACAPDYYNDNYGADWFLKNFVNESNIRKYAVNQAAASYQFKNGIWAKVCCMAADFNTKVHFFGRRFEDNLTWTYRWDMDVLPRTIETMYVHNYKRLWWATAVGYAPCEKVHLGLCCDALFVNPNRNYSN